MDFFTYFKLKAQKSSRNIAIGLGSNQQRALDIYRCIETSCRNLPNIIVLIGSPEIYDFINLTILEQGRKIPKNLVLVKSLNQVTFLISCLLDPLPTELIQMKITHIDGIIRGGISSSKFLHELKKLIHLGEKQMTQRLALLETAHHHQFFYAGVGIDEISDFALKQKFISNSIAFFSKHSFLPKIGILSGGRSGDIGRNKEIDSNIIQTQALTDELKTKFPSTEIGHYEILIEQCIENQCNIILPPDGISGNLIYRTLIHLGKGKSYGAIYLNYYLNRSKIIIDCSRIAPDFELEGSLYLALALGLP
jgi:predicted methyltransferase MtxX (methanogen marker protein 4)